MKKRILLIAATAIACSNFVFGQQKPADSLKSLLKAHIKDDTVKVRLMFDLARESRRSDPKLRDSLLDVILNLSEQLNYITGKGLGLTIKAVRYYDLNDQKSATQTFGEARQVLESTGNTHGLIYLLRMYANLLMDEGLFSQSLDNFLHGLKLSEEAGETAQASEYNRTIGYLYNLIGDDEKAIPYQNTALKQAQSIGYKTGISGAYNAIGKTYKTQGNYPASLEAYTKGLHIDEELNVPTSINISHGNIGDVYERMGKFEEAFAHLRPALFFYRNRPANTYEPWVEWVMGRAFTHSGQLDSGYYYGKHSYELSLKRNYRAYLPEMTYLIAESAAKLHKWDTAYKYLALSTAYKDTIRGQEIARKTTMLQASYELDKKQTEIELQKAENRKERAFLTMVLGGLVSVIVLAIILFRNNRHKQKANILLQQQKKEIDKKAEELAVQKDSLEQSYRNVELLGDIGRKITASLTAETIIGTVYDNVNSLMDASVFGIGIYHEDTKQIEFPATYENGLALPAYSNSIYDENRFAALCFLSGNEIVMGDLQTEYKKFLQNVPVPKQGQQPVSLIYLPLKVKEKVQGVITVQSFQKNAYSDYQLYMLRNIAIYATIALENADSFKKLSQTVDSLKKTQTQLIQSEKMASLGELTAGIAHEIQNPLNFVNNFSEVNTELIDELQQEIEKGNLTEIKTLAKDIKENEQKINNHGKRADAIVKGMLQHSRTSSGQKEMIEINELADEYLRLAYHGLRAKDKSFNAKFETEFDKNIGKVNIIPQDMGRVLVNLINNAFYTVGEKKKMSRNGFEPTVKVITRKIDDKVEIKVKDNGAGISQKVLDKIFQPFFTTKPAGQGTGLGLSLAYDIVKAHGGELKVETKEGEGSVFIILLPH